MRLSTRRAPLAAVSAAMVVLFATAGRAKATFEMQLSDGVGDNVTIYDNGTGDLSPTLGEIMFSGSVGNFTINVTTGFGSPVLAPGTLDLSNVSVTTTGGGTLTITLSQDGLTAPAPGLNTSFGGTLSSLGGGAASPTSGLTFQSEVISGAGSIVIQPIAASGSQFNGAGSASGSITDPYKLVEQVKMTLGQGEITSFDQSTTIAPVPSTMVLVVTAAPLLGLFCCTGLRRKRGFGAAA